MVESKSVNVKCHGVRHLDKKSEKGSKHINHSVSSLLEVENS